MSPERGAIVYDWNGTLLADTKLCVEGNNATFAALGLPHVSISHFRSVYEVPLVRMYVKLGAREDEVLRRMDELGKIFVAHYEKHASRLRARKGAFAALQELDRRGHKQAVLSNYISTYITPQAQRLKFMPFFSALLTNDAVEAVYEKGGKGKRLKAFFDKQDIERAIVIGDTAEEISIARDYGAVGVAIAGGMASTASLRAAKPDYLIGTLHELPAIATKVFGRGRA